VIGFGSRTALAVVKSNRLHKRANKPFAELFRPRAENDPIHVKTKMRLEYRFQSKSNPNVLSYRRVELNENIHAARGLLPMKRTIV
jgi:hypothetical protein